MLAYVLKVPVKKPDNVFVEVLSPVCSLAVKLIILDYKWC